MSPGPDSSLQGVAAGSAYGLLMERPPTEGAPINNRFIWNFMGDDVVMAVEAGVVASLRAKFEGVLPHLDERQQRLVMAGEAPLKRVRREGGGRKTVTATDPALLAALLRLVEPTRRGDPESSLCWTTLSTRKLAGELTSAGHRVGADTVARLLHEQGFSLQGNAKTIEGGQHPDRDAQFSYLNDQAGQHLTAGDPVISVDTKKKLRHEVARSE